MRDAANENISTQGMERKLRKQKWRMQNTTVGLKDTLPCTDFNSLIVIESLFNCVLSYINFNANAWHINVEFKWIYYLFVRLILPRERNIPIYAHKINFQHRFFQFGIPFWQMWTHTGYWNTNTKRKLPKLGEKSENGDDVSGRAMKINTVIKLMSILRFIINFLCAAVATAPKQIISNFSWLFIIIVGRSAIVVVIVVPAAVDLHLKCANLR